MAVQEMERKGLQDCLASENGRTFIWAVLSECRPFANAFTGNALTTAFNTGQQSIGQSLLHRITEDFPNAYMKMMQENMAREEKLREQIQEENEDEYQPDSE